MHSKPILQSRWNPVRAGSLVLCCGTGGMYMWSNEWSSDDQPEAESEEIAECIGIPASKFPLCFTNQPSQSLSCLLRSHRAVST